MIVQQHEPINEKMISCREHFVKNTSVGFWLLAIVIRSIGTVIPHLS